MKIELDEYDKLLMIGLARLGMETVATLKARYAYMLEDDEQHVLSDQMLFYSAIAQEGQDGFDYESTTQRTDKQMAAMVAKLVAINERIYQVQQAGDPQQGPGSGTLQ
jgi:hypothetical protein